MRNIEPPAKSKMAVRGTQNGQRGLESGPILGYWGSDQLSLNKFFDLITPSMRNIEPPAKSIMAARGPQNGRRGLERGPILGSLAL